jgi:hypothetical protein
MISQMKRIEKFNVLTVMWILNPPQEAAIT